MINFRDINYLQVGNEKQQKVYQILRQSELLEILSPYEPILTGTIPLMIDHSESDLDIICQVHDHSSFQLFLKNHFGQYPRFTCEIKNTDLKPFTLASFLIDEFIVEIFAQDKPTDQQNAYLHMINEYKILQANDAHFKEKIIKMKREGLSTEEAFAKALELTGDPYEAILHYQLPR